MKNLLSRQSLSTPTPMDVRRFLLVGTCALLAFATLVFAADRAATTAVARAAPADNFIIAGLKNNVVLAIFVVIATGMLVGKLEIAGVGLGSSGVLFAALLVGHLGVQLPNVIGTLGLVLFVYSIGLGAGPSFFRAFVRQGKQLAQLAIVVTLLGAVAAWGIAELFDVPADLAVGIFAGGLTSTPALATAIGVLGPTSNVSVGYGVAYPFGVAGVVLFVQLFPRLLGYRLNEIQEDSGGRADGGNVRRQLVHVANPAVIGRRLEDLDFINQMHCAVTRVLREDRLVPVTPDLPLEQGTHLYVVGSPSSVDAAASYLGNKSEKTFAVDTENERRRIVVTSAAFAGQPLGAIRPLRGYGVTVSRISRQDIDFVPTPETLLRPGDVLTVVGQPDQIETFAKAAGHRAKAVDETDVISVAIGIVLGILVGVMEFSFGEGRSLSLGLAGGPLLVALVLGHFGRIGNVVGYVPRASRLLMTEIGLVFFLAWAGTSAGGSFVEIVRERGLVLLGMGVVVTLVPMLLGYLFARRFLKMPLLGTLGGTCGGMTSTPGLGAITAKTDSEAPVISYAAAYPVALILMTVFAKILISLL